MSSGTNYLYKRKDPRFLSCTKIILNLWSTILFFVMIIMKNNHAKALILQDRVNYINKNITLCVKTYFIIWILTTSIHVIFGLPWLLQNPNSLNSLLFLRNISCQLCTWPNNIVILPYRILNIGNSNLPRNGYSESYTYECSPTSISA